MPKDLAKTDGYPALLYRLKKVFIEGLQKIEEEKVKTYWRTGQLISDYILENKDRVEYGENLFVKLEEDLSVERSTLQRSVQFYRTYPIRTNLSELGWSEFSPRGRNSCLEAGTGS